MNLLLAISFAVMLIAGINDHSIDKKNNPEYYTAIEQCKKDAEQLRNTPRPHYGNHDKYKNIVR
jgi:hypothetical protein